MLIAKMLKNFGKDNLTSEFGDESTFSIGDDTYTTIFDMDLVTQSPLF